MLYRLLQLGEQIFADGVDGAGAVEGDVAGLALFGQSLEVVGGGESAVVFIVVDIVTLVDSGLVLIVGAGLEFAAAHTADITVGLDGVDEDIVGVIVVVHAEAAAHDAVAGGAAGQEDLDHIVKLHAFGLEGFVELAGLFHVAGEAVEQPALVALSLEDVEHHGDGDVVGHEFALVDIGLGLHAQLGTAADVLTEDGTGFDVGDAVLFHEKGALGALAGGADEEQFDAACKFAAGLGLAFQIRDDMLDVIGTREEMGKGVGTDETKNTFVRLYGLDKCEELVQKYFSDHGHQFMAMSSGAVNATELVASLINRQGSFVEGIKFAQSVVEGTISILILKDGGNLVAARDKVGRLPVLIGKNDDGYAVTFESFAYQKLGYEDYKELGPGEIVEISPDRVEQLSPPGEKMKMCAFLWAYYGYPTATYEGVNVEAMRYRNGAIMAEFDNKSGKTEGVNYVSGVPDSGTPHAIGYSNASNIPFSRPFIKYTPTWPRSFMPPSQADRKKVAKMKLVPVHDLI